jgi:hypothetical protein
MLTDLEESVGKWVLRQAKAKGPDSNLQGEVTFIMHCLVWRIAVMVLVWFYLQRSYGGYGGV